MTNTDAGARPNKRPGDRRYQAVLLALPIAARRRLLYARHHRRPLRLATAQRFSEKVNWRIVHDRRELLDTTCDKLRTKQEAVRLGARVPKTYWSGHRLDDLAHVALPARWVLKPNHRTGLVHFGRGRPDVQALEEATRGWLAESQWRVYGEWAYGRAERGFLVEEWLGDIDGCPPDYKVFVFDGAPAVIQVDRGRFGEHTRRFYRDDWTPLDVVYTYPLAAVEAPPDRLPEMLDIARQLGSGFDFIRVDLYLRAGEVLLGEVTPYPGGGLEVFRPAALDHELGQLWRLPNLAPTPAANG